MKILKSSFFLLLLSFSALASEAPISCSERGEVRGSFELSGFIQGPAEISNIVVKSGKAPVRYGDAIAQTEDLPGMLDLLLGQQTFLEMKVKDSDGTRFFLRVPNGFEEKDSFWASFEIWSDQYEAGRVNIILDCQRR